MFYSRINPAYCGRIKDQDSPSLLVNPVGWLKDAEPSQWLSLQTDPQLQDDIDDTFRYLKRTITDLCKICRNIGLLVYQIILVMLCYLTLIWEFLRGVQLWFF